MKDISDSCVLLSQLIKDGILAELSSQRTESRYDAVRHVYQQTPTLNINSFK